MKKSIGATMGAAMLASILLLYSTHSYASKSCESLFTSTSTNLAVLDEAAIHKRVDSSHQSLLVSALFSPQSLSNRTTAILNPTQTTLNEVAILLRDLKQSDTAKKFTQKFKEVAQNANSQSTAVILAPQKGVTKPKGFFSFFKKAPSQETVHTNNQDLHLKLKATHDHMQLLLGESQSIRDQINQDQMRFNEMYQKLMIEEIFLDRLIKSIEEDLISNTLSSNAIENLSSKAFFEISQTHATVILQQRLLNERIQKLNVDFVAMTGAQEAIRLAMSTTLPEAISRIEEVNKLETKALESPKVLSPIELVEKSELLQFFNFESPALKNTDKYISPSISIILEGKEAAYQKLEKMVKIVQASSEFNFYEIIYIIEKSLLLADENNAFVHKFDLDNKALCILTKDSATEEIYKKYILKHLNQKTSFYENWNKAHIIISYLIKNESFNKLSSMFNLVLRDQTTNQERFLRKLLEIALPRFVHIYNRPLYLEFIKFQIMAKKDQLENIRPALRGAEY